MNALDMDALDTDALGMNALGARSARAGTSRIAAVGESERLRGFAFAGVHVVAAEDADEAARAAWRSLPPESGLVILTRAAHAALADELPGPDERLWVVMPA